MGAQGTATVDFGAFPGKSDASVVVTGQAGIVAGSQIEAWLQGSTADHTEDEHFVEPLVVFAGSIVAGTGFTIFVRNANQVNEPLWSLTSADKVTRLMVQPIPPSGGIGTRVYGQWKLSWVWN